MKVLVCGGRAFDDYAMVIRVLDRVRASVPGGIALVIHGGAPGADKLGGAWAVLRRLPMRAFPARWKEEGKAAGALRSTVASTRKRREAEETGPPTGQCSRRSPPAATNPLAGWRINMTRGIRDEDSDDKHEIDDTEAIGETDKALRVRTKEHGDVWVPKSVIHDDSEVFEKGGDGRLVVTAWFAAKQGW